MRFLMPAIIHAPNVCISLSFRGSSWLSVKEVPIIVTCPEMTHDVGDESSESINSLNKMNIERQ